MKTIALVLAAALSATATTYTVDHYGAKPWLVQSNYVNDRNESVPARFWDDEFYIDSIEWDGEALNVEGKIIIAIDRSSPIADHFRKFGRDVAHKGEEWYFVPFDNPNPIIYHGP